MAQLKDTNRTPAPPASDYFCIQVDGSGGLHLIFYHDRPSLTELVGHSITASSHNLQGGRSALIV